MAANFTYYNIFNFLHKKHYIFIQIVLIFVNKVPIDNKSLIQILAFSGDKPLSEPMMACFTGTYVSICLAELTHLPQVPSAAYIHQLTGPALIQIMACHLFGTKPLPELILAYCQLDP